MLVQDLTFTKFCMNDTEQEGYLDVPDSTFSWANGKLHI